VQNEEPDQTEEILVEEAFKWIHFMDMQMDAETLQQEIATWVKKALKLTLQTQVGENF
jgi:hypothetical protein